MPIRILIVGFVLALPSLARAQALPSPWTHQDIGATGAAGDATYSNGTVTVRGAGADIWGGADAFQFVYQPISGDAEIVARVVTIQNTHTFAKAGVMLREALTAGSRHVILDARPGGAVEFMTRQATDDSTQYLAGDTQAAPAWLKLARTGASVVTSVSADGATWRPVGTTSLSTTGTVYIGLAVTSHVDGTLNSSTFDNVTVTTAGSPVCGPGALPSPWADQDVGATGLPGCASH